MASVIFYWGAQKTGFRKVPIIFRPNEEREAAATGYRLGGRFEPAPMN